MKINILDEFRGGPTPKEQREMLMRIVLEPEKDITIEEFTWDFRVMESPTGWEDEVCYKFVEVHYEDGVAVGHTHIDLEAMSVKGLKKALKRMKRALDKPIYRGES